MLTREQRCDRLDDLTRRGLIIRGKWTDGERACLLAALSPEVQAAGSTAACPADVLPQWFAMLTTSIDDFTSPSYWPEMVREYGRVVRRAAVLTPEDWRQLDFASRAVALRVALPHAGEAQEVVERVIAMCERTAAGEQVLRHKWASAVSDAAAAYFAAEPGSPVEYAAETARDAAVAEAAATAMRAMRCGATIARAAAWDAMTKGILAAIDARCAAREAAC